jgi:hypothetical protein
LREHSVGLSADRTRHRVWKPVERFRVSPSHSSVTMGIVTFRKGVYDAERVVKSGTWRYAGEVTCDVRIVYSPIRWGSYDDDDDPPEMAHDSRQDTFYVEYGSTIERGVFDCGGGGFESLEAAMRHSETALRGVEWSD